MKDFDDFKSIIKNEYKSIRDKVELKTDDFCENTNCDSIRRNEVYAELFSVEVLSLYHEWINNQSGQS